MLCTRIKSMSKVCNNDQVITQLPNTYYHEYIETDKIGIDLKYIPLLFNIDTTADDDYNRLCSGFCFNIRYSPNDNNSITGLYQTAIVRIGHQHQIQVCIPNNAHWGFAFKTDRVSRFEDGTYWMKCKMVIGKKSVELPDGYIPILTNVMYRINSYSKTLYPSFQQTAYTSMEDREFSINIDIYKRIKARYIYVFSECIPFKII